MMLHSIISRSSLHELENTSSPEAVSKALSGSDPTVCTLWKQIPRAGETPEPEELFD